MPRLRPPKPDDVPSSIRRRAEKPKVIAGAESALKALRALTDTQLTREEAIGIEREIYADTNDRGAALMIGSSVENMLQFAIKSRLYIIKHTANLLFGINSPIGSFENKIRIAHALNIFGEDTYKNLTYIKAIRNAFAHAQRALTFSTPEVEAVCNLLTIPEPYRDDVSIEFKMTLLVSDELPPREKFTNICGATVFNLYSYAAHTIPVDKCLISARPKPLP